MPPLADFVCNAKGCRMKNGAAKVYELPLKSTHCPYGHKRIVRLYTNHRIGVINRVADDRRDMRFTSSSHAARTDAMVEQPVIEALAKRDHLKSTEPGMPRWKGDMGIVQAVHPRNMPAALSAVYGGHGAPVQMSSKDLGKALVPQNPGYQGPRAAPTNAPIGAAGAGGALPKRVEYRDTEYRIGRRKNKDGSVELTPEKAS